jgi:hypothetical protein
MLLILKKLKIWLIGVHFIMETDANTLVAQLKGAAHDHPGAMLTRWLAWIRLFDFEVRHVKGATHTAADALSRRPRHLEDTEEDTENDNDGDWILAELGAVGICPVEAESTEDPMEEPETFDDPELTRRRDILIDMKRKVQELRDRSNDQAIPSGDSCTDQESEADLPISSKHYGEHYQKIATYLTTLKTPKSMDLKAFRVFKKEALLYGVHNQRVWRLPSKGAPIKLVIDTDKDKACILRSCHDSSGHKGRESTYHRISQRYFWKGCFKDSAEFVKTCDKCMLRSAKRQEEPMVPTASNGLMEKWALDITFMPTRNGKKYLVVARDDISGWVEAKALASKEAKSIADFIW